MWSTRTAWSSSSTRVTTLMRISEVEIIEIHARANDRDLADLAGVPQFAVADLASRCLERTSGSLGVRLGNCERNRDCIVDR